MKTISFFSSLLLVFCFLWSCTSGKPRPRPNIILITMDTTRMDALGCYGNAQAVTPVLDALAASGNRFSNCFVQAPITLPSHTSIMTSKNPPIHGVRNNSSYRLSDDSETLAEAFKAQGYATGAFIGSIILDHCHGLDQGFDVYEDEVTHYAADRERGTIVTRRAEQVLELSLAWMDGQSSPFFAWLHFYDPHAPYDPPSPFLEAYGDNPYMGEIAYVDLQIGRLVRHLQDRGHWNDTLIVVTADHGEAFGEHGEQTHGYFCYGSTTHVPLIISKPLDGKPGHVYDHVVRSIDIAPTLLSVAGAPPIEGMEGLPLYDTAKRQSYSEAMIPFENFYLAPLYAARSHDYSYYESSTTEFYDLREDAKELQSDAAWDDQAVDDLSSTIAEIRSGENEDKEIIQLDQEQIEKLKSLGYIQDGGTFAPDSERGADYPSPLEALNVYRRLMDLRQFESEFPYKTIRGLKQLAEKHPDYIKVQQELGRNLTMAGDEAGAIEALQKAVALQPDDPRLHNMLGIAYHTFGHYRDSVAEFELALDLDPEHITAKYHAALSLIELGEVPRARDLLSQILQTNPDDVYSLNNLAFILLEYDSNPEGALELLERAQQASPQHPLIKQNIRRVRAILEGE